MRGILRCVSFDTTRDWSSFESGFECFQFRSKPRRDPVVRLCRAVPKQVADAELGLRGIPRYVDFDRTGKRAPAAVTFGAFPSPFSPGGRAACCGRHPESALSPLRFAVAACFSADRQKELQRRACEHSTGRVQGLLLQRWLFSTGAFPRVETPVPVISPERQNPAPSTASEFAGDSVAASRTVCALRLSLCPAGLSREQQGPRVAQRRPPPCCQTLPGTDAPGGTRLRANRRLGAPC